MPEEKSENSGYTHLVRVEPLARRFFLLLSVIALLLPQPLAAQKAATSQAPSATQDTRGSRKPSGQEIAEAKAKNLVWVNTATRVFHKEGPSYGTTSLGRFMTEDAARKAGYRPASEPGNQKAKRESSHSHP